MQNTRPAYHYHPLPFQELQSSLATSQNIASVKVGGGFPFYNIQCKLSFLHSSHARVLEINIWCRNTQCVKVTCGCCCHVLNAADKPKGRSNLALVSICLSQRLGAGPSLYVQSGCIRWPLCFFSSLQHSSKHAPLSRWPV